MLSAEINKNLEQQRIMKILSQNANKNFVQRILYPEGKPTLDLGNGNFATHKMAWTTVNGRPIVFPTVIQDRESGKLKELSAREATRQALKNNEFIQMPTNEDADWFSSNYKKVWDMKGKNIRIAENLRNPLANLQGLL